METKSNKINKIRIYISQADCIFGVLSKGESV